MHLQKVIKGFARIIFNPVFGLTIVVLLCIPSKANLKNQPDYDYISKVDPIYFYEIEGRASWYGKRFHGRHTANGERFDRYTYTAAHRTLPFGSLLKITNQKNNRSVIVRINDRGPVDPSRSIDLSELAAQDLDIIHDGLGQVKIEFIGFDENTTAPSSISSSAQ